MSEAFIGPAASSAPRGAKVHLARGWVIGADFKRGQVDEAVGVGEDRGQKNVRPLELDEH
ncbi:hypothetical protein [Lujinxingia litoralis]|nr:hypothetical protein [Lujinxingia litoralis]